MKYLSKAFFNVLCIVLLVFTTIAPSMALATSTSETHTLTIHAGSEQRTITSVGGTILRSANQGDSNAIYMSGQEDVHGNHQLTFQSNLINPTEKYKVELYIHYSEEGKNYNYIDEQIVDGQTLLAWENETIPVELLKTEVDLASAELTSPTLQYKLATDPQWNQSYSQLGMSSGVIVAKDPLTLQFSLFSDADMEKYLLNGEITVGTAVDFATLKSEASALSITGTYTYFSLTSLDSTINSHFTQGTDEVIHLTNGNYEVRFDNGNYWYGDLNITSNQTLALPTEPTAMELTHVNVRNIGGAGNQIAVNASVELTASPFKTDSIAPNTSILYSIYKGAEKVTEWEAYNVYSEKELDATGWEKGTYTLKAALKTANSELVAEKEFYYQSEIQALKGTIITADSAADTPLTAGTVSLFELKKTNGHTTYSHVSSEQIKHVNGVYEAFIPDAYLLDGKEYLLTIQDYTTKTAYAKKIVGQAAKNIHFAASTLKAPKLATGEFTTVNAYFSLYDYTGNYLPLSLPNDGWKIGTDFALSVYWNGVDKDETTYYSWSGVIDQNKDETGDIITTEWQTVKPAAIYTNAGVSLGQTNKLYKEFKFSHKTGTDKSSVYLEVSNGVNTYGSNVAIDPTATEQEVQFKPFIGTALLDKQSRKTVYTSFRDANNQYLNIQGANTFTYQLFNDKNEPYGNELQTDNRFSVELPERLPEGNYHIKLIEANVDRNIVSISMDTPLVTEASDEKTPQLRLDVNRVTKYGTVMPNYLELYEHDEMNAYWPSEWLSYDYYNNQFYSNSDLKINPTSTYTLVVSATIEKTNDQLVDEVVLSGQQLLDISSSNPLTFSENLKSLEVNYSGSVDNVKSSELVIGKVDETRAAWNPKISGNNKLYLPANGTYQGTYTVVDKSNHANVISIPAFTLVEDKILAVDAQDFAKVSVANGTVAMQIAGYEYFPNRIILNREDKWLDSIALKKGQYDNLMLNLGVKVKNDTPWNYLLSANNVTLDKDTTFNFSEDITGAITKTKLEKNADGTSDLYVGFTLTSGDFEVRSIYRSLKQNFGYNALATTEDPIREYRGLFNRINSVPVDYSLKDNTGKVVWELTGQMYNKYFTIDKEFAAGNYTVEVHIPTGQRKSITLTKELTVTGENAKFVSITAPLNGTATNAETVTVTGKANAEATVTLELQRDAQTVDTATVTVDADGKFTHSFKPASDGVYTLVAKNGETATASVDFKVDRTPPAKASSIEFAKNATGLKVSWTGADDVASYKVEVAENEEPFRVLSESQTENTAVIPTIKPGTTYKVKITSTDAAGNSSTSDIASYEVPSFVVTSITLEDVRNADQLLSIGSDLKISLEGSYDAGYTASVNVVVDGKATETPLTFNDQTKMYEGTFSVIEGMKVLEKVTGKIVNGTEETDAVSKDLSWFVGSTVKGSVTDGQAVKGATVRLSAKKVYTVQTNEAGEFEFKGLPEGTYAANVVVAGKSYSQKTVVVGNAEVVTVPIFTVPATTDATFTLVDKGTENSVRDGLSVRLIGPKGFAAFGTTVNGKFKSNNGKELLTGLETGEYKITVYGQGAYQTTNVVVPVVKDQRAYTVEVDKLELVEKDITITLDPSVKSVNTISLYSHSTYTQYGSKGVGSYYLYNVQPIDGKIVIPNVAVAEDYELYVDVDGFMDYRQQVDLKVSQTIQVDLEQGRVVSGKVTDSQGQPVANVNVYAYGGDTYASTQTNADGSYELIGLSKMDNLQVNVYSNLHLNHHEIVEVGTDALNLDIQLATAAKMTGKVVDHNGKALSNVSVSASSEGFYGWARTDSKGNFLLTGLVDTKEYEISLTSYGYPSVTLTDKKKAGDIGDIVLQKEGNGNFDGEGNFFAASKTSVVPGEEVQYTLSYKNNGSVKAENVPVTISLPEQLTLLTEAVVLNGKAVTATDGKVIIPEVASGDTGKLTFSAKVAQNVTVPSLTASAKVTEDKDAKVLTASTSVVFVTLEAPAKTASKNVKVYGNAKYGSTVQVFANRKLVGQTKVEGKNWFVDVKLPIANQEETEEFTLTAKVIEGTQTVVSKPTVISYEPDLAYLTDVTVHAGWNGDVKLNPYTGVVTFAIVENTPLHTEVKFDKAVDNAKISFLGKEYDLVKGENNTFTFNGHELGRWSSYGEQLLELTYTKDGVEITVPLMNIIVLIDPSGYVFEGSMDNRLEGVQAVVETKVGEEWVQWEAEKFGQVNPQVTDEEGRYGWDVISGQWRVIFTKEGYEPYISRIMNVPPPETELNIPMVKSADPILKTTQVSEKDLTIQFDRLMKVVEGQIQLVEVNSNKPVDGTLKTTNMSGYKSISKEQAGKVNGFAGQDSREEDGFFAVDDTTVSETFTFVPVAELKADTQYKLVISGTMADYAGKLVGGNIELPFTTAKAPEGGNPGGGGGGGGIVIPPTPPVDPKPEEPITPPVFTDIANSFAKNEINILAAKGIIQGKSENNFAPNAQISRAEFAVLLARALDLPMNEYEGKFTDVKTNKKWAYASIEAAARAGIVNGTKDGKFNPDAPIKREEIAAMVIRAIEYKDKEKLSGLQTPNRFKDHGSIGSFAIESVYQATSLGVIKGNNGSFKPKNNATRAESAVMLYRALDTLNLLD